MAKKKTFKLGSSFIMAMMPGGIKCEPYVYYEIVNKLGLKPFL